MFDGLDHRDLARRAFTPRTEAVAKPYRIIRYTGHPPVLEQIAGQVRSSSGMTYGRKSADGAKMPPAFTRAVTPRDPAKR